MSEGSAKDQVMDVEVRQALDHLCTLKLRILRGVSKRVRAQVSRERGATQKDLLVALQFCQAMRLVPRYSQGVAFERVFLELDTILIDAIHYYFKDEEWRAKERG